MIQLSLVFAIIPLCERAGEYVCGLAWMDCFPSYAMDRSSHAIDGLVVVVVVSERKGMRK